MPGPRGPGLLRRGGTRLLRREGTRPTETRGDPAYQQSSRNIGAMPSGSPEVISVARRQVPISNPDKVLSPERGHTKRDLVHYYLAVADGALRPAGDRPNVLVRY